MEIDSDEIRKWGVDPLSKHIDEHVASMPDRPKILIAVIFYGRESDEKNADALRPLTQSHFSTQYLNVFHIKAAVAYLGFDSSNADEFVAFWDRARTMRVDEMAVFIDGKATFQVATYLHDSK